MKPVYLFAAMALFAGSMLFAQEKGKKAAAAAVNPEPVRTEALSFSSLVEYYKSQLLLGNDVYQDMKDLADRRQGELDTAVADLKSTIALLDAERPKDDPDLSLMRELILKRGRLMGEIEIIRFGFPFECKAKLNSQQTQKWKEIRQKAEERARAAREKPADTKPEGKPEGKGKGKG